MAASSPLRAPFDRGLKTYDLNLFLLGKTGHGKSATGNSILSDAKAFKKSNLCTTGTTSVQTSFGKYKTRGGRLCKMAVIDGPGLQDTNISKAQDRRRCYENIARVLKECDSGVHAFILTLRLGVRFTNEDTEAVTYLKRVLGNDFLRLYGTIVVTHGDALCNDEDDEEAPKSFKEWCNMQKGPVADLFEECDYRCVLFDNSKKVDESTKIEQLETLFETIGEILKRNGGKPYTTALFQNFAEQHQKLLKEFGLDVIKKDFRRLLSEIQKSIRHTDTPGSTDLTKASKYQQRLLAEVSYEVQTTGNPKKLEADLTELEVDLAKLAKPNETREQFKELKKAAEEKIDKIVDRASFPDDPNVCQKLQLRFDDEYAHRYF